MAKLTLIGRLGAEPETRMGKNEKEFVQCVITH
jgi:single-stranded DNA-binding protein